MKSTKPAWRPADGAALIFAPFDARALENGIESIFVTSPHFKGTPTDADLPVDE